MDALITNLIEHGPWGLTVALLAIGNAAQWKIRVATDAAHSIELAKCWGELRELSIQTATALVEWNMLERAKKR